MSNPIDEKKTPEALLSMEPDIISNILAATKITDDEIAIIEIVRGGKVAFSFRIHPLSETEYQRARKKHTNYKKVKSYGGMKLPEETDTTAYRSELIILATVAEDKKIWSDKRLMDAFGVVSQLDVVDKVLRAGEKDRVVDKINEISGFSDEDDDSDGDEAVETLKN